MSFTRNIQQLGCLAQLIVLVIITIIGEWSIGYSMDILFAEHGWHEANVFARYGVGMLTGSVIIWIAIILFILSLAVPVPFF